MPKRRGRTPLTLIEEPRKRRSTFLKRSKGMMKAAMELQTLCDVPTFVVCYGPDNAQQRPLTWPEDKEQVLPIIHRYVRVPEEEKRRWGHDMTSFRITQIEKLRSELQRVCRGGGVSASAAAAAAAGVTLSVSPTFIDVMDFTQLKEFERFLEDRLETIDQRILYLQHHIFDDHKREDNIIDSEQRSQLADEQEFSELLFSNEEMIQTLYTEEEPNGEQVKQQQYSLLHQDGLTTTGGGQQTGEMIFVGEDDGYPLQLLQGCHQTSIDHERERHELEQMRFLEEDAGAGDRQEEMHFMLQQAGHGITPTIPCYDVDDGSTWASMDYGLPVAGTAADHDDDGWFFSDLWSGDQPRQAAWGLSDSSFQQ